MFMWEFTSGLSSPLVYVFPYVLIMYDSFEVSFETRKYDSSILFVKIGLATQGQDSIWILG